MNIARICMSAIHFRMSTPLTSLDWDLVHSFLAVAETGSLSAAARRLGTSQPTLGRQIKTMETQLGAELFHRAAKGFDLTQLGAALMEPARAMRDAVHQIELAAAGRVDMLEGTVRITASVATSIYTLPAIIAQLRRDEPSIQIELVPSDQSSNLLYREADIAIRMYRPEQLDLVTQHLGDIPLGLFASRAYLAQHGNPTDLNELMQLDLIGYDANPSVIDGMREVGIHVTRHDFPVRCDDNAVYWELLKAGCGLGFAQRPIGRQHPDLQEIDVAFPLPGLPVWLTAHEAMRHTPRIRRVWDALAAGMKPLMP